MRKSFAASALSPSAILVAGSTAAGAAGFASVVPWTMVRAGDAAASGAVGVGVGLEGEVGVEGEVGAEGEVGGGVDGAVGVGLWDGAVTASAAAACSSMSACGCSSAMRSFARCTHFCSVG